MLLTSVLASDGYRTNTVLLGSQWVTKTETGFLSYDFKYSCLHLAFLDSLHLHGECFCFLNSFPLVR